MSSIFKTDGGVSFLSSSLNKFAGEILEKSYVSYCLELIEYYQLLWLGGDFRNSERALKCKFILTWAFY